MGWEAGVGLVLLRLVHLDLFVVLQETAACTQSWGACVAVSVGHRR